MPRVTVKPLFRNLPDDCSTSYRNIFSARQGRAKDVREYCEALWLKFHDLADSNFVNLFPFDFHKRWFEMYLGASLRDANLAVAPSPKGKGPDFSVTVGDELTYIEAITPESGSPYHSDHVPEPTYADADGELIAARVPHTPITLRLANAFQKKARAFDRYRMNGTIARDSVCIIAINLWEVHHAWADAQEFWMRALYGVGDRFVAIDRNGGATVEGRQHRELLHGAEGVAMDVAALLNPVHADISGVIGSAAQAGGMLRPLGDDFVLMPHVSAKYPTQPGFISRGIELKLTPSAELDVWDVETTDYGAVDPQGPNVVQVQHKGEEHEVVWQVTGRELSVRVGKRGITQPINRASDAASLAVEVANVMLGHCDTESDSG